MAMQFERVSYQGWENSYRLWNEVVDLVVVVDIGPRIIRFGFVGEENEFKVYPETAGATGGNEWRIYGGHRLWHAPEARPRTYVADNSPVAMEKHSTFIRLVQPTEAATGIQKELDVRLFADEAKVEITHRLRNANLWPVELAPWAVSVMDQGGTAIMPLPPRGSHGDSLLATNTLALWPYTDMTDRRWSWGSKYVCLRQDPTVASPQKAGVMVKDGWVGYVRGGHLFLKTFAYEKGARYPDLGCSVEAFTDADKLELETLGPLTLLQPGGDVEHVERWFLFRDVPTPMSDTDVDEHVLPKVQATNS